MIKIINLATIAIIISQALCNGQIISSGKSKIRVEVEITDSLPPEIILLSPELPNDGKFTINNNKIDIIGEVKDHSAIRTVVINSLPVTLSDKNVFTYKASLNQGNNEFSILAVDESDNYARFKFTVDNITKPAIATEEVEIKGEYYGLLIGVDHYSDPKFTNLDNPISDAQRLYNVLISKYNFAKENIKLIRDANYKDIIKALDELSKSISVNDNLLIFYAGHGWWDKDAKAIGKLYELKSRKAMTSGTLTTVPDRSSFTHYLLNRLENNEQDYLSSEQLFSSIRIAVINNSDVIPQYGEIMQVGDEGGDFIFVGKNK